MGFDGIEIDMLSLGDADSTVVTKWENGAPHRILIDGGKGGDAEGIIDFLLARGYTHFWAAICTHLHDDHASGLAKMVRSPRLTIQHGVMHDIRKHVASAVLLRASSSEDGVKDVIETTRELESAFVSRKIPISEVFAGGPTGGYIADWPATVVLGPSVDFYESTLKKFTDNDLAFPPRMSSLASLFGGETTTPYGLGSMLAAPVPSTTYDLSSFLDGALENSSVKENPKTQPFNNTSIILGVLFNGQRLLFTADAGSEALDRIPPDWKNLMWMQVPHHCSEGNLSQKNIERFCPKFANISACGDSSHPSRAIVNGLIKVGAQVFSTHTLKPGHLWFHIGNVPARPEYGAGVPLKATGDMKPFDWTSILSGQ